MNKVIEMKKLILLLICCIMLTGCNKTAQPVNKLDKQFQEFKNKLEHADDFLETTDEFAIHLIVNKIDNEEYRYDVIIDMPVINMYHLQAIAKIAGSKNESMPTLGVLENDVFSLVPGVVDKEQGIYKGVNLSGITKEKEFTVLIYLTFSLDKQSKNKEERYIKLYGNAS